MKTTDIARRDWVRALGACGLMAGAGARAFAATATVEGAAPILVNNDRVRVVGVVANPGQPAFGSQMASQPPRLAVFMHDARVKFARNGEAPRIVAYKTGDYVWDAGDVTFADNADNKSLSVYLVEPKGKPAAGAANPKWQPTSPQVGGRIVYENDYVRVIEHAARPRMGVCGEGMHTHADHLTIGLAPGRIRVMQPDKEPVIVEAKAGDVFWDPSGPHAIQNLGSRDTRAFLIEIKTA